jgi:hypothetical protein
MILCLSPPEGPDQHSCIENSTRDLCINGGCRAS